MMKPMLLTTACALFLSIAAAYPSLSPQNSCKDLANFIQESTRLPSKPDEDGVVTYVNGSTAKKMFPGVADRLSIFKKYTFVTYFNTCELAPAYTQIQVKSGPYKLEKTSKSSYSLGLDVGIDANLAEVFKYLPKVSVKAGVTRGSETIEVAGVDIKEGELKQECVASPGWHCTALVRLDEYDSGVIIIDDRIRQPVFFPAALNGKSLYSNVWLEVPSTLQPSRFSLQEWFC